MLKFFKVVGWFFTIAGRYEKEKRNYQKSGWAGKLVTLLIIPVFLGLGVVSAYGAAWLFKSISFENFTQVFFGNILKIIGGLILGYIALGISFKGFVAMLQHAIIAFSCAAGKKTIVEKVENKIEETIEDVEDDFLIEDVKEAIKEEKQEIAKN